MSLPVLLAAALFVGVLAYGLFGGADFGSGFFDLTAGNSARGAELRTLVDHSIGPVWEANHVWLIYEEASDFFERGAVGYSPTHRPGRYEGLALQTSAWRVEPVRVDHARSSYFEDPTLFPPGSAELDHALLMRRVPVVWETAPSMAGHR